MIIKKGHPLFGKCTLIDTTGKIVPMVQSWDAEKEEAEILIGGRPFEGGTFRTTISADGMVSAKVKLPGCYLRYNDTKKRVPREDLSVDS